MRRVGMIAMMGSAVLAAGVVTGGVLAVSNELDVENDPGEALQLEGVETGAAAASSALTGARVRAEGTTPKVTQADVTQKPGVDEVEPSGPVRIAPQPAPAAKPAAPKPAKPAAKKPGPPKPATVQRDSHKGPWDDWKHGWNDRDDDRRGPGGGDKKGPGGGDRKGGGPGPH